MWLVTGGPGDSTLSSMYMAQGERVTTLRVRPAAIPHSKPLSTHTHTHTHGWKAITSTLSHVSGIDARVIYFAAGGTRVHTHTHTQYRSEFTRRWHTNWNKDLQSVWFLAHSSHDSAGVTTLALIIRIFLSASQSKVSSVLSEFLSSPHKLLIACAL